MSFRYPKGGFIQLFFDPLTPGPAPFLYPAYTWGSNAQGQLGQNNVTLRSSPIQLGALTDWLDYAGTSAGGNSCMLAVKNNGTLWAWGQNINGQLAQNDVIYRSSPTQVGALTTWSKIAVGSDHILAIKTDGTLWSWGSNNGGQLGLGYTTGAANISSPIQVGALTNWSDVGACISDSFAIKTDGTLWSWGENNKGQLGQDVVVQRSSPVQVGALTVWSKVKGGNSGVMAYQTNGTAWAWGDNQFGQCGQNSLAAPEYSSPVQIGALTTWSDISTLAQSSSLLKNDGTIWTFGRNNNGQLGHDDVVYRSSPTQVGALTTWSKIFAGTTAIFAINTSGELWVWGQNGNGRLGINNTVTRSSPVQVGALTTWSFIAPSRGTFALGVLKIPN